MVQAWKTGYVWKTVNAVHQGLLLVHDGLMVRHEGLGTLFVVVVTVVEGLGDARTVLE